MELLEADVAPTDVTTPTPLLLPPATMELLLLLPPTTSLLFSLCAWSPRRGGVVSSPPGLC